MSGQVHNIEDARARRARRESAEDPLTKKQLATLMGVHVKTIERWTQKGMPVAFRLWGGSGAPRYYLSACVEWHASKGP